MENQLFRSRKNRIIAGVCGGIAEYFSVDPTLVRLIWVIMVLTFGAGILAYIIAAVIMPERAEDISGHDCPDISQRGEGRTYSINPERNRAVVGIGLVLIGILFLAKQFFHWIDIRFFWPIVFIAVGFLIILRGRR